MKRWIWTSVYFLICCSNCHAEPTTANQTLDEARKAIYDKNYAFGIALLKKQIANNPLDSHARYLMAKAYAWKGDISAALEQLDRLIKAYPNNSDYLLSKARFLSWQNKNDSAIHILEKARKITPQYKAIWELEITLSIRKEHGNIIPSTRKLITLFQTSFNDFQFSHYLNTTAASTIKNQQNVPNQNLFNSAYLHDRLDNNTPDWQEFILNYNHRTNSYSYQLGIHAVNRFKINDHEFSAGISLPKSHSIYLNSQLTFSTEQILLARWSLYTQIIHPFKEIGTVEADLKHSAYPTLDSDVLGLAYSHYWGKLETKLRGILSLVNGKHFIHPPGYLFSATYFFNDRQFIRVTQSINTELILTPSSAIRYEVKTYSIDGKLPMNKQTAFTMALSHYKQGNAYNRNEIYVGIQYQY